MGEYRALREKHSLLEICRTPELAAEATLQPIEAFGFDAAIIFADILLPITPMGMDLEFVEGTGPVINNPVRSPSDVDKLQLFEPAEELSATMDAIRLVRSQLLEDTPLIGFAGAPFTLASYLIEGGGSRNFRHAKTFMMSEPGSWHRLLELVSEVTIRYLRAQIDAGAQAVQLFDSWIGALSPADYREFVKPHSQRIFQALKGSPVPLIHFGTNNATLLQEMVEAGGDVIGVDWRIPVDQAWQQVGHDRAIQGNLDPISLFAPEATLRSRTEEILERAAGRPGHIFNLGHGILPQTPTDSVETVLEVVRSYVGKQ
jgi:uroporphyrinogen decarboxylase